MESVSEDPSIGPFSHHCSQARLATCTLLYRPSPLLNGAVQAGIILTTNVLRAWVGGAPVYTVVHERTLYTDYRTQIIIIYEEVCRDPVQSWGAASEG